MLWAEAGTARTGRRAKTQLGCPIPPDAKRVRTARAKSSIALCSSRTEHFFLAKDVDDAVGIHQNVPESPRHQLNPSRTRRGRISRQLYSRSPCEPHLLRRPLRRGLELRGSRLPWPRSANPGSPLRPLQVEERRTLHARPGEAFLANLSLQGVTPARRLLLRFSRGFNCGPMDALPSPSYERHEPKRTLLHAVVREPLPNV